MAHVWQALIEQIDQTGTSWEPTNDNGEIAANEMRQMVAEAPEVFEAFGRMWQRMASKCTDQIWMDSGAADALHQAAQYCRAPAEQLRDTQGDMDRPHDDDLTRIGRDQRAEAWDWRRNQGYNV
jgi:hypothetical protein